MIWFEIFETFYQDFIEAQEKRCTDHLTSDQHQRRAAWTLRWSLSCLFRRRVSSQVASGAAPHQRPSASWGYVSVMTCGAERSPLCKHYDMWRRALPLATLATTRRMGRCDSSKSIFPLSTPLSNLHTHQASNLPCPLWARRSLGNQKSGWLCVIWWFRSVIILYP